MSSSEHLPSKFLFLIITLSTSALPSANLSNLYFRALISQSSTSEHVFLMFSTFEHLWAIVFQNFYLWTVFYHRNDAVESRAAHEMLRFTIETAAGGRAGRCFQRVCYVRPWSRTARDLCKIPIGACNCRLLDALEWWAEGCTESRDFNRKLIGK